MSETAVQDREQIGDSGTSVDLTDGVVRLPDATETQEAEHSATYGLVGESAVYHVRINEEVGETALQAAKVDLKDLPKPAANGRRKVIFDENNGRPLYQTISRRRPMGQHEFRMPRSRRALIVP